MRAAFALRGAGRALGRARASAAVALPRLEPRAQVAEEASRVRAVDEAMVVRQRDVHQRADRDHVLAELVLDHPRALHERIRAEDAGLRLADHGRAVERA